ncbi:hypothetical protein IC229_16760, partial [Spirosoma sp. BT702]
MSNPATFQQKMHLATSVLRAVEIKQLAFNELSDEEAHRELDYLVAKYAGPHCKTIDFHADALYHGKRHLIYDVVT